MTTSWTLDVVAFSSAVCHHRHGYDPDYVAKRK
jgi:cation transporter-like permease